MRFALGLVRQARRPLPMRSRGSVATGGWPRDREVEPRAEEWVDADARAPVEERPVARSAEGAAPARPRTAAVANAGEVEARAFGTGPVGPLQRDHGPAVRRVDGRLDGLAGTIVAMSGGAGWNLASTGEGTETLGSPMRDGSTVAAASHGATTVARRPAQGTAAAIEPAADASDVTSILASTPTDALELDAREEPAKRAGAPTEASPFDRAKEAAPTLGPDALAEALQPEGASPVAPELTGARVSGPRTAGPTFATPAGSNALGRAETDLGMQAHGAARSGIRPAAHALDVPHPVMPELADPGLAWLAARSFPLAEASSSDRALESSGSHSLRERTSHDPARIGHVGEAARAREANDAALRARSVEAPPPTLDHEPVARSSPTRALELAAAPGARMPADVRPQHVAPERDPSPPRAGDGPSRATTLPRSTSFEAPLRMAVPASRLIVPDDRIPMARARRTRSAAEPAPVVRIGTIEVFMVREEPHEAIAQTRRRPDPPPWSSDLGRRFLRKL
jgi:hypothetical protein